MDKYQKTIETFNNVAAAYWEKFKDFALYQSTYDDFIEHLSIGELDLLEIACGPGHVSQYLLAKRPAINLLGIDLAPKMIELARQHNQQAMYQIMDCRMIISLNQSFDAIMCGFCIPYLNWSDSQKLIQDMCHCLVPGGTLYISYTEGDISQSGYQGSQSAKGSIYVHYHDINAIEQCLKQSGLQIISIKRLTHVHNQQTTKDVFILAKKAQT